MHRRKTRQRLITESNTPETFQGLYGVKSLLARGEPIKKLVASVFIKEDFSYERPHADVVVVFNDSELYMPSDRRVSSLSIDDFARGLLGVAHFSIVGNESLKPTRSRQYETGFQIDGRASALYPASFSAMNGSDLGDYVDRNIYGRGRRAINVISDAELEAVVTDLNEVYVSHPNPSADFPAPISHHLYSLPRNKLAFFTERTRDHSKAMMMINGRSHEYTF